MKYKEVDSDGVKSTVQSESTDKGKKQQVPTKPHDPPR